LRFVDTADKAIGRDPSRITIAWRGSVISRRAIDTANRRSPSKGVCTGRRLRAKPSAAMIPLQLDARKRRIGGDDGNGGIFERAAAFMSGNDYFTKSKTDTLSSGAYNGSFHVVLRSRYQHRFRPHRNSDRVRTEQ
jgi:hypothetical protein